MPTLPPPREPLAVVFTDAAGKVDVVKSIYGYARPVDVTSKCRANGYEYQANTTVLFTEDGSPLGVLNSTRAAVKVVAAWDNAEGYVVLTPDDLQPALQPSESGWRLAG